MLVFEKVEGIIANDIVNLFIEMKFTAELERGKVCRRREAWDVQPLANHFYSG